MTPDQIHIIELIWECPLGKPLENCPFKNFRNKTFQEVRYAVISLKDDNVTKLCCYHNICLYLRGKGNLEAIKKLNKYLSM